MTRKVSRKDQQPAVAPSRLSFNKLQEGNCFSLTCAKNVLPLRSSQYPQTDSIVAAGAAAAAAGGVAAGAAAVGVGTTVAAAGDCGAPPAAGCTAGASAAAAAIPGVAAALASPIEALSSASASATAAASPAGVLGAAAAFVERAPHAAVAPVATVTAASSSEIAFRAAGITTSLQMRESTQGPPVLGLYEPPVPLQQQQQQQRGSSKARLFASSFLSTWLWWLLLVGASFNCWFIPLPPSAVSPAGRSLLSFFPSVAAAATTTTAADPCWQELQRFREPCRSVLPQAALAEEVAAAAATAGKARAAAAEEREAGEAQEAGRETAPAAEGNAAGSGRTAGAVGGSARRLGATPEAIVKLLDLDKSTGMLIGVLLTLCGSILMAGGSTFMKMGLNLETEGVARSRLVSFFSAQCCEPLWCAGLAAYSVGALMHIIALAFAPASVLAPMNSVGLIANAITAATVLKEPFGFRELLFTGGTAVGVTLCAGATLLPHDQFVNMTGNSSSAAAAAADVALQSWGDPWYLAYLACCVVPGFATLIVVNAEENAVLEEERDRLLLTSSQAAAAAAFDADRSISPKRSLELARLQSVHQQQQQQKQQQQQAMRGGPAFAPTSPAGAAAGPAGDAEAAALQQPTPRPHAQPLLSLEKKSEAPREGEETRRALLSAEERSAAAAEEVSLSPLQGLKKPITYPRCIGLSYGFLAGLTGAQCVLELKELAACFHKGVDYPNIWVHPQPYLVVVFLVASVWTQIHFLNLGLARGDATLVVPTYYVSWTFFGTLGGFAKFHEIQGFSMGAIVLFSLGFGLTTLCIAILAVQEMTVLRRFVDERVPDLAEEEVDLRTQELQEQQLAKQVTLAMGLFPFSMLGRTVGRRRFRPLYQRFRRTRSTASDTALNDAYGELTLSSAGVIGGAYTLPHSLYFHRTEQQRPSSAGQQQQPRHLGAGPPGPFTRETASTAVLTHPASSVSLQGQQQQQQQHRRRNSSGGSRTISATQAPAALQTVPRHGSSRFSSSDSNRMPLLLLPPPSKQQQPQRGSESASTAPPPATPGRRGPPRTWTLSQQQQLPPSATAAEQQRRTSANSPSPHSASASPYRSVTGQR